MAGLMTKLLLMAVQKPSKKGKLKVIKWLQKKKLLTSRVLCSRCGQKMKLTRNSKISDGYNWWVAVGNRISSSSIGISLHLLCLVTEQVRSRFHDCSKCCKDMTMNSGLFSQIVWIIRTVEVKSLHTPWRNCKMLIILPKWVGYFLFSKRHMHIVHKRKQYVSSIYKKKNRPCSKVCILCCYLNDPQLFFVCLFSDNCSWVSSLAKISDRTFKICLKKVNEEHLILQIWQAEHIPLHNIN